MTERRYTDDETTAIFHLAAEGSESHALRRSGGDGLTLDELQAIGEEVGISSEAVARAARALEVRKSAVSRRLLGLPIGVERRVALGRRLTDDEWEQLVVELRDVFKARGRMKAEGSLRQWTNGNLYVLLEPTPTGHRIRLGSLHGGAAASLRLGIAGLASAAVLAVASFAGVEVASGVTAMFAWGGALMVAVGAVRVPGWARLRARQMEDLALQLVLPADAKRDDTESLPPPNTGSR